MTNEQRLAYFRKIIATRDIELMVMTLSMMLTKEDRHSLTDALIALALKEHPDDPKLNEAARRWGLPA